jgi:hypothetical protein
MCSGIGTDGPLVAASISKSCERAVAGRLWANGGIGSTFFSSDCEDALDQIKGIGGDAAWWGLFGRFRAARFILAVIPWSRMVSPHKSKMM